ncbi:MAG: hypothetical protein JO272_03260 [Pseudonocardiales bacterium]|nr:hypothetical protein [Pseudonocardiales bacterium]
MLPELGGATWLQRLDLSGNLIANLPPELGKLPDTVSLKLDGNPLREPLPELYERGVQPLLAYLRGLTAGATARYEAKLILVGEGNVGKSSLVASLQGQEFVEERPTTHGIHISRLRVPNPDNDGFITLNTWDFGGQEVYRVTHQFFFSRRCLYLLVWRPREGQEENAVEEWCRRIRLRIGADARVLIVATHADERRSELDYPELRRQFGELLVGHCEIDNRTQRGIDQLKTEISRVAATLPQMGELMSEKWMAVRSDLQKLDTPQIPYSRFDAICAERGVESDQRSALIGLLHDLGHLIYYGDDDGLRDIVILQPEWLTKAIGYVLEDEATAHAGGVIKHSQLHSIWQNPERDVQYPPQHHAYFLRLMEKFDVSYRVPDEDQSLVAQLAPYDQPELPWGLGSPVEPGIRELQIVCRMSDIAPGIMAWLTVRNHRFSTRRHWRRGVFLEHTPQLAQALLIHAGAKELHLRVRAPSPDYFFSVLRDSIEDLIRRRWEGLSYDLIIPCLQVLEDGSRCTGQFELHSLQKYREQDIPTVRCARCIKERSVSELMTGFASPESQIAQLRESIYESTTRIRQDIHDYATRQEHRLVVQAAETAHQLRILLKAVTCEAPDCPRLFTLVERQPGSRVCFPWSREHFRLTLWCEHPGHEHLLLEAQYEFTQPKHWFVTIAPYILVLNKVLQVTVLVACAAQGAHMPEVADAALRVAIPERDYDYEKVKKDLDLMKALVDRLQKRVVADSGVANVGGAEFRALRELLLELDPARLFGGLRRVLTPEGDYLWICPPHYREYDPGLPELP